MIGIWQGENDGIWAWTRFNQLFNYLPLAALIEKKIICMHGGIGRSIHSVEQIEKLERPITMDAGSIVLMDLLWYIILNVSSLVVPSVVCVYIFYNLCIHRSDPTENDSVEGLRPNARGPGLVTFGVIVTVYYTGCFLLFLLKMHVFISLNLSNADLEISVCYHFIDSYTFLDIVNFKLWGI